MPESYRRRRTIPPPFLRRKRRRRHRLLSRLQRRALHLPASRSQTSTALTQSHYRRAADSYALDAQGVLQICNGIDTPLHFDPSVGTTEEAGVKAPTHRCVLTGTGSGQIVGTYYAYVRFVDRYGYFSSLSQISDPLEAESAEYSISAASNASPIVITASTAPGTGSIVKISRVGGNSAANGTWYVKQLTSTTFELWSDELFASASVGNGDYTSGGRVSIGQSKITYTDVAVPVEDRVVRRQILRNKDGDLSAFYVDIDTEDLTSTTFESITPSNSLLNGVALFTDSGLTQVDKTRPPDYKKINAHHLGRLFMAGNEPYSEGAVSVTNGSKSVTGIGTEWGPLTFRTRKFEVIGGGKEYEIEDCPSTTSLLLKEAYEGSTSAYASYVIHSGDGERRTFYWSEPGQPEAFPLTNTLTLEEDVYAGEITALIPMHTWLYIGCEHRLYNFSFVDEPLLDGYVTKGPKRGCVNNRCWQTAEAVTYMMDYNGFHAFSGNDDADISTPGIQDLFRTRPMNKYRINWSAKRHFHSVYDPGEATIRWFVSLGSHYTPQHALCYQIRLRRWWIEEYPFPVGASVLGRINGKPQVFLGTNGRRLMALGASTLDGVSTATGTLRGSVTSSGVDWIADSSATFPSGMAGNPLVIVRGKGKGQRRIVASVSGTRVNVIDPWLDRPDTTSVFQVGGIAWRWKSGWMLWAPDKAQSIRGVVLQSKPTDNSAELWLRVYHDLSEEARTWTGARPNFTDSNGCTLLSNDPTTDISVDTTKATGFVRHTMDDFQEYRTEGPRFVQVEINGVPNDEPQTVYRLGVEGAK